VAHLVQQRQTLPVNPSPALMPASRIPAVEQSRAMAAARSRAAATASDGESLQSTSSGWMPIRARRVGKQPVRRAMFIRSQSPTSWTLWRGRPRNSSIAVDSKHLTVPGAAPSWAASSTMRRSWFSRVGSRVNPSVPASRSCRPRRSPASSPSRRAACTPAPSSPRSVLPMPRTRVVSTTSAPEVPVGSTQPFGALCSRRRTMREGARGGAQGIYGFLCGGLFASLPRIRGSASAGEDRSCVWPYR